MSESKATPRPWRIEVYGGGRTKYVIGPERSAAIASVRGFPIPPEQRDANAELIVRAVNCHDDLVSALERMLNLRGMVGLDGKDWDAWFAPALAALQKARAKT